MIVYVGSGATTLIDPAKSAAALMGSIALAWLWQIGYAAMQAWRPSPVASR